MLQYLSILLMVFSHCTVISESIPPMENGKLEIQEEWLEKTIPLKGTWLYREGLVSPEEFLASPEEIKPVPIPSASEDFFKNNTSPTFTIYAIVQFPKNLSGDSLSLFTNQIWSSHKIIVNGKTIEEVGKVSDDPNIHEPVIRPITAGFPYREEVHILIQVSNFTFRDQGILLTPKIGITSFILQELYANKLFDISCILVLTLFMFINFGIYLSNRRDHSSVFYIFMMGCLVGHFATGALSNRMIWDFFPGLTYEYIAVMDFLFLTGSFTGFFLFVRYIYPDVFNLWAFKAAVVLLWMAGLTGLILPRFLIENFLPIFLFSAFIGISLLGLLCWCAIQKRDYARLIFSGFLFLGLITIHDNGITLGLWEGERIFIQGILLMFVFHFSAFIIRLRKMTKQLDSYAHELEEANKNLENRITERTDALKNSMIQLKETNRLKDRFLSIVSHDIRGPLGGVSGVLNILLQDKSLEEESKENFLRTSKSSVDKLLKMTEEILSYAKNQSNRVLPVFEEIELLKLTKSIVERLHFHSRKKNISIEMGNSEEKIFLIADHKLMEIAISNLVSNAIKFTPPGEKVHIGIRQDSTYCYLSLKNLGEPMDEGKIKNLYDYNKNKSTIGTAGELGSGFGLPFTKEILESMQVDLSVESEDSYIVFTAKFPIWEKKILVLDDNPNYRESLRNAIREENSKFLVVEKENVDSATEQISKIDFDLLITDYHMPGKNGLNFAYNASQIYEISKKKAPPILMITSWTENDAGIFETLKKKAESAGIQALLSKNSTQETAQKLIAQWIHLKF